MNDVIVYVDRGTVVEERGGKVPEEGDHVNDIIVYLHRQRGRCMPEEGEHIVSVKCLCQTIDNTVCPYCIIYGQTLSIKCPNIKFGK